MIDLTDSASARSRLFQLLAVGFTHPVSEFHWVLVDGSFTEALAGVAKETVASHTTVPQHQCSFADFEADYIHLFQMGRGGKPIVALTAGDHKGFNTAQDRPEFLLQYTAWYKHFGLKMNEDEGANELPDHLVCQLEFMAWLAHLEDSAREDFDLKTGYQNAQRDFLQHHLQPFLAALVTELERAADRYHINPFFPALAALALEATDTLSQQFDKVLENASQTYTSGNPDQIAAVNLWG